MGLLHRLLSVNYSSHSRRQYLHCFKVCHFLPISTHIDNFFGGGWTLNVFLVLCRELRCLRNTIHTHLMFTYISADALWLITSQVRALLGYLQIHRMYYTETRRGLGSICSSNIMLYNLRGWKNFQESKVVGGRDEQA